MKTAWLVIADSENRVSAGNQGYEDDPLGHYSWNDTVPHCNDIKVGDILVVRSKRSLLGAGVVEEIVRGNGTFDRRRCLSCNSTDVRERKTKPLRFKCGSSQCKKESAETQVEVVPVEKFAAYYRNTWVDLYDDIDMRTLKSCCLKPKTQHSMSPLHYAKFFEKLPETKKRSLGQFFKQSPLNKSNFEIRLTRLEAP